jgi:modulator of FtsH protease
MNQFDQQTVSSNGAVIAESKNKVLRNTYWLLSLTLLFSAGCAMFAMATGFNPGLFGFIVTIGLLFAINWKRNTVFALPLTFLFTGLMGMSLGPVLTQYLSIPGGSQIVGNAMFTTAAVFLSLSAYAVISKKDFSFLGGFLFTGLIIGLIAAIALMFFEIPGGHLALSVMMALVASGLILFDTSRIVNGGETNYVSATVSLFLDIYLLFSYLLMFLGMSSDD